MIAHLFEIHIFILSTMNFLPEGANTKLLIVHILNFVLTRSFQLIMFKSLSFHVLIISRALKDGSAFVKIQIENKIILSTNSSVKGPHRMKEEYVEGILELPIVIEDKALEQLKEALGQAANAVQLLPVPVHGTVTGGLKISLSKLSVTFWILLCNKSSDLSLPRALHNQLNVITLLQS